MDVIVSTLAAFWLILALFFVLIKRGLWIFNEVSKSLSMFMLEKALGPAIDFVSGRSGSASTAWIIHGFIWTFAASTFTFVGLWLTHDSTALHSFGSWGYHPNSSELIYAGRLTALFGAIGMLVIGASLYALPKLSGTDLASESNATLVSLLWTFSVLLMFIGSQNSVILGITILPVANILLSLASTAIAINMILTISEATQDIPFPGWLILFAVIGNIAAILAVFVSGAYDEGTGQWLLFHLSGGTFFFCGLAGVSLYSASVGSGNPLWSKSLVAFTLFGALVTINPMGSIDFSMVTDLFSLTSSELAPSSRDVIAGSFLMALSAIPIIAFSANMLVTMRGSDAFVENPDSPGIAELNLGSWMLVPVAIGALFVQTDALGSVNELTGISQSLDLMAIWLVMVPLSIGAALNILPRASGRHQLSANRSRWAYWMMTGGAFLGLLITLMSDFTDMALTESMAEQGASINDELRKVGSVMFYGTVIGAIFHCTNAISGQFRGRIVEIGNTSSISSISIESYTLTSPTSIRKILASGATLDTEVSPSGQSEEEGSATEL
ncbi:MAG: hypothetical protein CMA62_01165 [Euryarchaeota archaeon]|nr:hypothetical protein [Euryarchaeota archaeon]